MTDHTTRTTPARHTDRTDETALAAVVCGIIGLFFLNVVLGPIALALGVISLRRRPRTTATTAGAWTGLLLGAADLAVFAMLVVGALHGGALMLRFGT